MSLNLTAHTQDGHKIELYQLNTNETKECLNAKTWQDSRDKYLDIVEHRSTEEHVRDIMSHQYLEFSYE